MADAPTTGARSPTSRAFLAMADVVIAGGGPAGRHAGPAARARGSDASSSTRRKRFPREKPCGEGIMPAGVAVLERLGLRDAVGGRPLDIGPLSRLRPAAPRPASRRRGRRGARRARRSGGCVWTQALLAAARATPGVRVFEEAPVEGAAIEAGARSACGSVASSGAAGWWSAPTASTRRCAARSGSIARAARRPDASACGCTSGSRPGRPEPSASRSSSAGVTSSTSAPLPDGELLLAALGDRGALAGGARAAFRRWIAERAAAARLARRRDTADAAGGSRAGHPPRARRVRPWRRAAGRRRLRHRSADRGRHRPRAGHRRAAGGDRPLRARRGRRVRSPASIASAAGCCAPHDWLTRALVFLVERPLLARRDACGRCGRRPGLMRALLGVGGGVGIQPPPRGSRAHGRDQRGPRAAREQRRPTRTRRSPSAPDRRSRRARRAPPARSRSAPAPAARSRRRR